MTPTTYTNQTKTHGPHVFFCNGWKKQHVPKAWKRDRNGHENYSIVTPLCVFHHSQFAGKYSVCSFPGRFCFHLGCLFFFGKPKTILVLLTTKPRLRDCSNEVSCWKCSKDLWWPEFFGLFGWGDGHLRVYTKPANARPSTKALLRDIFFKGQWWLSHSEVLLFPLLGSLDFHDERSMITFPETNMITPTRGCVGP